MINKILKYVTLIGIAISIVGFVLMTSSLLSGELVIFFEKIYKLTITVSCLFVLTRSQFINEKFSKILKASGVILLLLFGLNLLTEFNLAKIESMEIIAMILISGLYFLYLNYFRKKKEKVVLDYLKIAFLTLVFIGGFLELYATYPIILKTIIQSLFWLVIIGILMNEHKNQKIEYAG